MTYRFWLWPGNNHTKAYESGTQHYEDDDLKTVDGVITLHIHATYEMCQKSEEKFPEIMQLYFKYHGSLTKNLPK